MTDLGFLLHNLIWGLAVQWEGAQPMTKEAFYKDARNILAAGVPVINKHVAPIWVALFFAVGQAHKYGCAHYQAGKGPTPIAIFEEWLAADCADEWCTEYLT